MMMSTKRAPAKQGLLRSSLRAPIWLLARVRDLCLLSLTGGGGHVVYSNAVACPTPQIPSLPRSVGTANSPASNCRTAEKELSDVIKLAASGKIRVDFPRSKTAVALGGRGAAVVPEPRSYSVGFERIDEDRPLDCGEEERVDLLDGFRSKGRTHAVGKSTMA